MGCRPLWTCGLQDYGGFTVKLGLVGNAGPNAYSRRRLTGAGRKAPPRFMRARRRARDGRRHLARWTSRAMCPPDTATLQGRGERVAGRKIRRLTRRQGRRSSRGYNRYYYLPFGCGPGSSLGPTHPGRCALPSPLCRARRSTFLPTLRKYADWV